MNSMHRQATELVRSAALELHRVLMNAVRVDYERAHGRIESASELLHLLENEETFAWLRPLSELLVAFDELLDLPYSSDQDAAAVRLEVEQLLSGNAERFSERYLAMLQNEPDVVMAHSSLKRAISALPSATPEDIPKLLTLRSLWRNSRTRPAKHWTH